MADEFFVQMNLIPLFLGDSRTPASQKVSNIRLYIPHAGFDTVKRLRR